MIVVFVAAVVMLGVLVFCRGKTEPPSPDPEEVGLQKDREIVQKQNELLLKMRARAASWSSVRVQAIPVVPSISRQQGEQSSTIS